MNTGNQVNYTNSTSPRDNPNGGFPSHSPRENNESNNFMMNFRQADEIFSSAQQNRNKGQEAHVELLRRTLASEALVQQVLAAWRTATAGRPKGEDLYSPRKDLGADLHSDFPS